MKKKVMGAVLVIGLLLGAGASYGEYQNQVIQETLEELNHNFQQMKANMELHVAAKVDEFQQQENERIREELKTHYQTVADDKADEIATDIENQINEQIQYITTQNNEEIEKAKQEIESWFNEWEK